MNNNLGIEKAFSEFGNDFGDALREEWKRRLLDDKVEYKRSILLSLRRQYSQISQAQEAGFTAKMLKNAVEVLRKNGYFVDMEKGIITK